MNYKEQLERDRQETFDLVRGLMYAVPIGLFLWTLIGLVIWLVVG